MRALHEHEALLRAYVEGCVSFEALELAIRGQVRAYATRRFHRWAVASATTIDDVSQVMLAALWRALDSYAGTGSIASWCGPRVEFALRGMRRSLALSTRGMTLAEGEGDVDEVVEDEGMFGVELRFALEHVDDGIKAWVLSMLDVGGLDARERIGPEMARALGWSDVALAMNAARRRAQRSQVILDVIGGA